jgi:hypothetical protein
MRAKDFFNFYGVYLQIILAAVAIVVTLVGRDVLVQNWPVSAAIALVVLLVPCLVFGIASFRGAFAKWLRLMAFSVFKVEKFAGVALLVLVLFSFLFLFNLLFRNAYMGEQIFLNVFLLNLLFVFFLALVVGGKFQIAQPSALLIRNNGQPAVYLYQDGVIRHIPDRSTFRLLGYSFDDVVAVNDKEFVAYTQRPPIDSVSEARLVKTEKSREVWIIFGDVRKHIPDAPTLEFLQKLNRRSVDAVSEDKLQAWVEAKPLTSILDLM